MRFFVEKIKLLAQKVREMIPKQTVAVISGTLVASDRRSQFSFSKPNSETFLLFSNF